MIGGRSLSSITDTGAPASTVSSRFITADRIDRERSSPVKLGNGQIVHSKGTAEVDVTLGRHVVTQRVMVLDTTAFECVLGMDFLSQEIVHGILFRPARLVVQDEHISLREENGRLLNTMFRM